ncbi:hypothetical protein BOTBODRAFT_87441, partial [Botryobasidium botryosum FD-172 SS1]
PQSSSFMLPSPPSEVEAMFYYAGLPSDPVLVARTSITPWEVPTGAYWKRKWLHPVGKHALQGVWEGNLAPKLHALLDRMGVKWTSTDVVRIANAEESSAPVILWIGVAPASLFGSEGVAVAFKCRDLLAEYDIADVDVEIRESMVVRSDGPKLITPADIISDSTAEAREPLTTMLGLPICAQSTPWAEGTGGFFVLEGGDTQKVLLVTARHVVLTPQEYQNTHFKHENDGQPRYTVTLFGDAAFKTYLESIKTEIRNTTITASYQERRIKGIAGKDDPRADRVRWDAQRELAKVREATEQLNALYNDVATRWITPESRLLGHVILSPPVSVVADSSSEGYTEDWAVIEIDANKVDESNFFGNAIDLGTRISIGEFMRIMCPGSRDNCPFEYPLDRLLKLGGTIPDDEMRCPTAPDHNGNMCLMVLKRGNATGLTIGCANSIFSYARRYHEDGTTSTSKEWAILPFDSKSGNPFSAKGDSGSVVVDGLGRMGGLLTGGAGTSSSTDLTYATPINFLLRRMQESGL